MNSTQSAKVYVHKGTEKRGTLRAETATEQSTHTVDREMRAAEMHRALSALLVAIDCGGHEKRLEKSNPLCVSFARLTLARYPSP